MFLSEFFSFTDFLQNLCSEANLALLPLVMYMFAVSILCSDGHVSSKMSTVSLCSILQSQASGWTQLHLGGGFHLRCLPLNCLTCFELYKI